MSYFSKLEGQVAVVRKSGGYRQVDLYSYGQHVFFKYGSDFVRINGDGRTSKPDVFVEAFPSDIQTKPGPMGQLLIATDAEALKVWK